MSIAIARSTHSSSSPSTSSWRPAFAANTCYTYSDTKRIIDLNNKGAASLVASNSTANAGEVGTKAALSPLVEALKASKSCLINRSADSGSDRDDDTTNGRRRKRQKREEDQYPNAFRDEQETPLDIDRLMEAGPFGLKAGHEGGSDSSDDEDSDFATTTAATSSSPECEGEAAGCYDGDFVYDRPIYVKEDYARHSGVQRSETVLPSIIIFNLALANHLLAIRMAKAKANREGGKAESEAPARRDFLKKAAQLYQLSVQLQKIGSLQQEQELQAGGPENATRSCSKLLFLSCVNNLGNVYKLLGDDEAEENTHKKLLAILMYLNYKRRQREQWQQGQRQRETRARCKYEPFYRNLFKKEVSNKAPAA